MRPLVSVLMPVYNAERFLSQAIESILQQSFSDFEFIIIDDCSSDSSADIIHSYNDNRIRYFRNGNNLGISATLNAGIDLARGEYIARMDADDVSYIDRLEKQVRYLAETPDCALTSSWVRLISEEGKVLGTDCSKSEYYFFNLIFVCWIYHPTVVFRKDAVLKAGKYRSKYSEDFDMYWHLTRFAKIHIVPEILLDYRITAISLSRSTRKSENELAQEEQVRRNVDFYVPGMKLSSTELQLIRHTFDNLVAMPSNAEILRSLQKLEQITLAVLNTSNPNYDAYWIRRAANHRRVYMLQHFAIRKNLLTGLVLLLHAKAFRQLPRFFKRKMKPHADNSAD